jgi:RNA-binding protein
LSCSHPVKKGTSRGYNLLKLQQALAHALERQGETVITPKIKRRIKRELSVEKPTVWVGKEGATPHIVNEVSRQLEKREIVKAKILRSALKDDDAKSVASKIAQQTNSSLIEVRGHTFLLYRHRKKEVKSL